MARSDLLIALVKAGATGDRDLAKTSAEALIADEKSRQHHVLADRLTRALSSSDSSIQSMRFARESQGRNTAITNYVINRVPRRQFADLTLPATVRASCERFIEEQRRSDLLRSYGVEPRNTILFTGPPGNGKTSLAESLAEALSVPFLIVRYDAIIGSFLGETASRLKHVFEYACSTACVLFFDEFDAVGKERGDIHETGEIKRVVNSLLLQMDAVPSWTIIVAATNHAELLDRAAWRRFQIRLEIPQPSERLISEYIKKFFDDRKPIFCFKKSSLQLAKVLHGASFAEVEEFCVDIVRSSVLSFDKPIDEIIEIRVKEWRQRSIPSNASEVIGDY